MSKIVIAFLTAMVVFSMNIVAGKIEGMLYPVVDLAVIDTLQEVGETSSRITGHTVRRRECSFVRLEWYLGTPEANALVDVEFEEGSKVRPAGRMDFGPWLVQLTPDQLRNRSYAVVYHRCHLFWLTRSHFYN